MSRKAKVMIVEDHPIFRKGLAQLINEEKDMEICGEAEDVIEAKKILVKARPDMMIVDLTLKGVSGLNLIKDFHEHLPDLPILVLSMHDESIYAERVLRAGARGYIMKQEMTDKVIVAIRHVLAGKMFFSESVVESFLGMMTGKPAASPQNPIDTLSDRELEVFTLIGKGTGRKEIGDKLHVSIKTVGTYREKIKMKLGIKSSPELVRRAVEWVQEQGE
ncbi:MAG: DNA-binding response regulator [Deltaproteobacteria bacterium HGW-Deltaproteobacteria-6]|jgi:DNA-binding NarL/FixJ family response regulator|nr:MAG: DNA-binding response regulator [Deltaproteobacteria bacterium HGW-Deltaproteobacteria-6]